MNKELYTEPKAEVIVFSTEDIMDVIDTSAGNNGGNDTTWPEINLDDINL